MDNLFNLFADIGNRTFKTSTNKNGTTSIQQTERNTLRKEILDSLLADFKSKTEYAYPVKEGIMVEVENSSIADSTTNGSGAISLLFTVTVKDLDTVAEDEYNSYQVEVAEKEQKAKEKAEKKAVKIARDTADREKRK